MAYRKLVSEPIFVSKSFASSDMFTSSSSHRMLTINFISFSVYGFVWMIKRRSNKSIGMP